MLTSCFFFYRLIKLLWTRFGSSIRRVWHETAARVILFTLIYLSALARSLARLCLFSTHRSSYSCISVSQQRQHFQHLWFFFFSCVYAAHLPSINIIIVILVDADITVCYIPGRVLTLTPAYSPFIFFSSV